MLNVNRRFSAVPSADASSFLDVSVMSESVLDASKSFLGEKTQDLVNETQLPESVFHFPAEKIMKAVDQSVCCDGGDGDGSKEQQQLSPVTLKMMACHRLKEYDNLMSELRDSSKRRASIEGQVLYIKKKFASSLACIYE